MKITAQTRRKRTIRIANDDFTLFNRNNDGSYSNGIKVKDIYAEWGKAVFEQKYGVGTDYKGLLVIDGTKPFVTEPADGFFTISKDDRIVPFLTDSTLAELLEDGEKLYTVKEVSIYTRCGCLLSVEVLLG